MSPYMRAVLAMLREWDRLDAIKPVKGNGLTGEKARG